MEKLEGTPEMQVTQDEYISMVRNSLGDLTEEKAIKLVSLGSAQGFINDNDIFEAIHTSLGLLEVPLSDAERIGLIKEIRELVEVYEKEKRG